MTTVYINKEPVELFKLLKFEGLVASGGEAKMMVAEGQVMVNGEVELRKRKKILAGDQIEFNGLTMHVALEDVALEIVALEVVEVEDVSGDVET